MKTARDLSNERFAGDACTGVARRPSLSPDGGQGDDRHRSAKSCAGSRARAFAFPAVGPARVLAIFLLAAAIALALFSKAFRFGRDCQKTIGESARRGQVAAALAGGPAAQGIGAKLS